MVLSKDRYSRLELFPFLSDLNGRPAMASTSTKIGHGLAKVLGINLHYRNETGSDRITRGESVFSVGSAETYTEDEPTAVEWLQEVTPSLQDIGHYFVRLFPFLNWITRYNLQWLIGDLVAGLSNVSNQNSADANYYLKVSQSALS